LERGLPTTHFAAPLKSLLMVSDDNAYMWASPKGKIKGLEIKPLYQFVPDVVTKDFRFYEMLCLVDSLRVGG
jgi:hypothetical protein